MALVPSLKLSFPNSQDLIESTCLTGRYDAITNVGGFGVPNDDYSDVVTAEIRITDLEDNVLQTIVVKSVTVNQYPTSSPYSQEIPFSEETWEQGDGVYKYEYEIVGTSTVTTGLVPFLVTTGLCQCISNQKLKALNECNDEKKKMFYERVTELSILLMGIQSSFACGNFEEAAANIVTVSKICSNFENCQC